MDSCLAFVQLLKRASCVSEKRLAHALADSDLTLSQAMLLIHLSKGEESMSKLGTALCCHKSNITQLVEVLTKRKLILRCDCGEDRRVQCVTLTPEGRKIMEKLHAALGKNAHGCLEALGKAEQRQLLDLLTTYVEKNSPA